jgi:4-hydroxy-3-methylbut-2-enyl diphosphate reductase IspH
MKEYQLTIYYQTTVIAENSDEVLAEWENELATSNQTIAGKICENATIFPED